jgi:Conjugal transfer protein TraD
MSEHTPEQGLRVHHLVNLGGLIAVAGLDQEPPDFLLGALVSIAHERAELTSEQRAQVSSLGQSKLDERATSKRAWNSWRKQKELHSLLLSSSQMRTIVRALGGAIPTADDQLIDTLTTLLKGAD